jgi:hypothetical protein
MCFIALIKEEKETVFEGAVSSFHTFFSSFLIIYVLKKI